MTLRQNIIFARCRKKYPPALADRNNCVSPGSHYPIELRFPDFSEWLAIRLSETTQGGTMQFAYSEQTVLRAAMTFDRLIDNDLSDTN